MEERFEDTITYAADNHPMHADEYHGAIGIIHNHLGMDSVQHFTEEDEGK